MLVYFFVLKLTAKVRKVYSFHYSKFKYKNKQKTFYKNKTAIFKLALIIHTINHPVVCQNSQDSEKKSPMLLIVLKKIEIISDPMGLSESFILLE